MKNKTIGVILAIAIIPVAVIIAAGLLAPANNIVSANITESVHTITNSDNYSMPLPLHNNLSTGSPKNTTGYDSTSAILYELHDNKFQIQVTNNTIKITVPQEFKEETATIPIDKLLFYIQYEYDASHQVKYVGIGLKPNLVDTYKEIGFSLPSNTTVFIYPTFTQSAYSTDGFYDYYAKKCDSRCLTVGINNENGGGFVSSERTAVRLSLLNYSMVTDVDVDKNPDILKKYQKVILLHNEYVTKKEFDAITSHPNVLYLYADALHAEVDANYTANTIKLIRGHGYPQPDIINGFDWKYDNSKYEYDIQCDNWTVQEIPNGKMVNCYPAYRLYYDKSLWDLIKN